MKAIRRLSVVVALLAIAGCAGNPPMPEPRVEVVEKLVPQRCIDPAEVPVRPVYQGRTGRYVPVDSAKLLLADLEAAKAYADALAALLPPCLRTGTNRLIVD